MPKPFSAIAWERNSALYETIRTMPFNNELADGSLSAERFKQYIVQDAHYLIGYGRALALTAAKAPDPDTIVQFAAAAQEAIVVERALHGSFLADWGIDGAMFENSPVSPAARHYLSYLVATAHAEPYEVVMGAILPCFWVYAEVGTDILGRAAPQNPYQAWIDTYAGEEFQEAARKAIAATDRAADNASPALVARMHEAFTTATKLEWMFWDSAYRQAAWPVAQAKVVA